jgi:O-antigen/teichoic acid export membrane protein
MIAAAIVEVTLSLLLIKPKPKFIFKLKQARVIISQGKWITLSGVLNYIASQGPEIAIGKLVGTTSLGLFQVASRLAITPATELTDTIGKVTFPLYVKITTDVNRVRRAFIRNLSIVVGLLFPVVALIAAFPAQMVTIVLGPNWLGAVAFIPELAIYSLIRILTTLTAPVILSFKKQRYLTVIASTKASVILLTIVPLTLKFGVQGALHSLLLSALIVLPLSYFLLYGLLRSTD